MKPTAAKGTNPYSSQSGWGASKPGLVCAMAACYAEQPSQKPRFQVPLVGRLPSQTAGLVKRAGFSPLGACVSSERCERPPPTARARAGGRGAAVGCPAQG